MEHDWCVVHVHYCTVWGLVWKMANGRFAVGEKLTWHMTAHCDTGTNTPHLRLDSAAIHHHFLPVLATCTPPLPVLHLPRADLGIRAEKALRNVATYKTQAKYTKHAKTPNMHIIQLNSIYWRASIIIIIKVKLSVASSLILNLYEEGWSSLLPGRLYSTEWTPVPFCRRLAGPHSRFRRLMKR
jgi:hypothetical protein